jgi:serine phosphatase RsbU (regulator of sigma subunit)/PAS domain-containing protein
VSEPDLQPTEPVLAASQALRFIAHAGEVLSSSLDYAQTLRQVARLAVPELADWCAVYILGDGDPELEITSGHPDPEVEAMLLDIRRARRGVEGASESRRVAESTEPILAADVRGDPAADLGAQQMPLLARLAPRSYMLVPLLARGRSLGSLTLLSTREGRHYTDADLAFTQTLAARCALAIDNARLHDTAERSLSLLDTVFATAPVGLAFLDCDLRFVRINDTMAGFNQRPIEAHLGRTVAEVLGEDAAELEALCRRVRDSGRGVHDLQLSGAVGGEPGGPRHWSVSCTPVHGPDGELLGVSVVVLDVTERQRLLEAEREGRARADFLARAGAGLDGTLDYEQTLSAVAGIAVPEIADWCGVSILDETGTLRQVAATDGTPAGLPSDPSLVARTGRTEFLPGVLVAALRAHGRTLGTLTLARTGARAFERPDVQLAEELARRAGNALDNARLYTERSHIAHALQAKLLPERLPDIPGALLAARYRAAGELNEVGGDFYDVFPRSAEEWAIVVGDVSGKGPEAAAVTAVARYTLRAGALDDDEPAKALRRLNGVLRPADDSAQYATAVLAYLSTADDGRLEVRLSLAGHPPAMVLRRDGAVDPIGSFGDMLAMVAEPVFHETEFVLDPGDTLLLYTDGVTEAGPRTRPFGEFGFPELLRTLAGEPPQVVVDAIEQAVVSVHSGEPRDDIALLAIGLRTG